MKSRVPKASFAPPANNSTFKEVLIFEERLKQNAERLQKQRRQFEAFLVLLIAWICYLTYSVFVLPSVYSLVHYSNVGLLLVSLVTLALFFATGIYADKIAYAYKFVPQTNRALRPFNVYLNTRSASVLSLPAFLRPAPPLSRSNSTSSVRSNSPTPSASATLSRRTSSSSAHSSAGSIRSTGPGANRSPPASPPRSPTRAAAAIPLAPIPPAQNARGELIFSSRVSGPFREGYERYRSEWEKRREEQLRRANGGWWAWFGRAKPVAPAAAAAAAVDLRGRKEGSSRSSSRPPTPSPTAVDATAIVSTTSTPASSRAPSPAPTTAAAGTRTARVRAESFSELLGAGDAIE